MLPHGHLLARLRTLSIDVRPCNNPTIQFNYVNNVSKRCMMP